ncbi:MAG TPA: hypothetical protein VM032_01065 [Vicinamibacterales bacterium]|nr:hypothetical protein [Vicinamibacterales bacterium]
MTLLSRARVLVAIGLMAAGAACTPAPRSQPATASAAAVTASAASAQAGFAPLALDYATPAVVGTPVRVSATGLPPGKVVDLVWGTVSGGWVIEDYYHFRGKKYSETTAPLGRFTVDAGGALQARFTIPEDFGGVHEVTAIIDGTPVAQNGINVTQTFELSPTSGPVGTPLELKITGLGWRTMESTWVVNWDNQQLGFLTAAGTRGSAVARFRASGPAGDHTVKLYTGWQAQAYLNYEQSPVADLPRPQFTFTTTAGQTGVSAYAEPYRAQPLPKTEVSLPGAALTLKPSQGPVGTRAVLRGTGFTAGERLQLAWQTAVGSRVSGNGFAAEDRTLGAVDVRADGSIEWPFVIPEDLGGVHGVAVMKGTAPMATTHFAIETSIVEMTPRSGPAGTPVTIHLKGVGWTEYDNIYVATYDNAYMGYACGFNSQGDVVINFTAAGAPGAHLIDLYPGIYQGPASEPQQLYRQPQLTYADDHPGNLIPALRFLFEVTPGPTARTAVRTHE